MRRHPTIPLRRGQTRYSEATRDKLFEAAGRAFAERGYASATVRDICKDAGANVAAVNYYFKDKLALYTEVLRQMKRTVPLQRVREALDQDASPEDILRDVVKARLLGLHGQKLPDWHFRIIARELAQPTPAMGRVINECMRPIYQRLLELIGKIIGLPPDHETTRLCTHSIMGQIFLYVLAGPVLIRLWPELEMTPQQLDRIADHIADFSLAYLHEVGAANRQTPRLQAARRLK